MAKPKELTKRDVDGASTPGRAEGESEATYRKRWTWLGDGEVRGFGVKVYGSGRKMFALRYRTRTGRQRMTTLGAYGELTVKQARDKARAEKVRILNGEDPQAERERDAARLATVRDLMTVWLTEYAAAHRKRWQEDKGRVERHIIPKLGRLRLEDVSADVLARWHRTLGKRAKVEANRCLETLRTAWTWAEGADVLPEDAPRSTLLRGGKHARVKRFRESHRDRWLRTNEMRRLMEAVQADDDPYVRAAIPLYLLTGLRKRELLHARWEDVDMDRGELYLPDPKTGTPQTRLLPAPAVRLLRELPRMAESPYVFPSPADTSKPRDDIKKAWNRIRKAAGLAEVTLHDLRRTAGSHLAQAGVPIQVIGEILGHSHPGVTKLYARLSSQNAREALDTLGEILSGPLGLTEAPKDKGWGGLPDQLRALLEATPDDPEALAAGLLKLRLGKAVEA